MLSFELDGRFQTIPDSYLLVGLDETGHEQLHPVHHPVFGLGGCAVRVSDYERLIAEPWARMKSALGISDDKPFHSTEQRFDDDQARRFGEFFRETSFGRIAALVSTHTNLSADLPPYEIAARWTLDAMVRLMARFGCRGLVLVLEESARTDRLAATYFEGYSPMISEGGLSAKLEFLKFKASKQQRIPVLEIADAIVHTARAHKTGVMRGNQWGRRRDYQSVFQCKDRSLVEFVDMIDATTASRVGSDRAAGA